MEVPEFVKLGLWVAGLIFFIVIILFNPLLDYLEKVTGKKRFVHWDPFPKKLNKEQVGVIRSHFRYYRSLDHHKQGVFESRVAKFLSTKRFISRGDVKVDEKMKILVAATAVMLTFGLRRYRLNEFKTFLIYPGEFMSKYTGKRSKGETNGLGIIVYSWKDFMFGIDIENDNINLGLHEMAHALFMERLMINEKANDLFVEHYDQWEKILTESNLLKIIEQEKYFRNYALTNKEEFFAVAIENFFESPDEFYKSLPVLFNVLCAMLNQDPRKKEKLL